ncbi:MAG: symmetrical bis(5'-nucleosyl)-tetraphosphatase [Burkholderiales bacterium]
MSTYAIGDIQGCYAAFDHLLDTIGFEASRDRLWLVGDLVNRGPESLAVLRRAMALGNAAITTLGNHDLHLLAVAAGFRKLHRGDTLDAVLAAPDRDELLDWLRRRNMMHVEGEYALVHAGLLPQWTTDRALELAREVETALRGACYHEFLEHMYGNQPDRWSESLAGTDRLRVVVNAMTRMRVCTPDGAMQFGFKGRPEDAPEGYLPWFGVPGRASRDRTVICGHWSALGLLLEERLLALDSGCLWGGTLSAVRLEDRRLFQVSCARLPGTKKLR